MCICGEGAGCLNQAPMEATYYGSWRQADRPAVVAEDVDANTALNGEDGDGTDD